jgi:hypothetical protein
MLGALALVTLGAHAGVGKLADGRRARAASDAQAEASAAWGRLSRCMVGQPMSDFEQVIERLRAVKLALIAGAMKDGVPLEARWNNTPEGWPGRCATYAHELHVALKGVPALAPVASRAHLFAVKLAPKVPPAEAESTFAILAGISDDLAPQGIDDSIPAPELVTPRFAESELAPLPRIDVNGFALQPAAGGDLAIFLSLADELCTFAPDLASGRCAAVPGRNLGSSAPGQSPVVYDDSGVWYGGAHTEIEDLVTAGVTPEGTFVAVRHAEDGLRIERRRGDEHATEVVHLRCMRDVFVLGSHLVATCGDIEPVEALRLSPPREPLGEVVKLEPPPEDYSTVYAPPTGCWAGKRFALVVPASPQERRRRPSHLSYFEDGAWSAPIDMPARPERLSCSEEGVVATAIDGTHLHEFELVRSRCDRTSCATDRLAVGTLLGHASHEPWERYQMDLVDLGGRVAFAFKHPVHGLWLRVAAWDELARTPAVLLASDEHGLWPWQVFMQARGPAAALFIDGAGDESAHVLRVASDGGLAIPRVEGVTR